MKISHRQKIISLVESAVIFYNRAVKLIDLQEYARSAGQDDLCNRQLSVCLARLVYNGEIYIAKQGRKDKFGGNFYLPKGIEPKGYVENLPLSWLDIVWQSFREIWENRKFRYFGENLLPDPISTEEVEEYILGKFGKEVFPKDKTPVAYALGYLSRPKPTAVIKKLRRQTYGRCLWIPANISAEEYKLKGKAKNKSEAINILVRRAVNFYKRPVTADEITKMTETHPNLKINGQMCLNDLIANTKFSLIKRIATIMGERYYFFGEISSEEIETFVLLRNSEIEWEELNFSKKLDAIAFCKLPTISLGRLQSLKTTVNELLKDLEVSRSKDYRENRFYKEIDLLRNKIESTFYESKFKIEKFNFGEFSLPNKLVQQRILLNSVEVASFLRPFFVKFKEVKDEAKAADLIGRQIPKYYNPNYKPTFNGNQPVKTTSRYLFDKFDVLTYTVQQAGGNLSRSFAMMAQAEMGDFRDARFLLSMLESKNYEHRLTASVCLAFLQDLTYENYVYNLALFDVDAGVRKVALWAYVFMNGNRVKELTLKIKEGETHNQVLELLSKIEEIGAENIWSV